MLASHATILLIPKEASELIPGFPSTKNGTAEGINLSGVILKHWYEGVSNISILHQRKKHPSIIMTPIDDMSNTAIIYQSSIGRSVVPKIKAARQSALLCKRAFSVRHVCAQQDQEHDLNGDRESLIARIRRRRRPLVLSLFGNF
jgi:hypothetical protein